MKLRPMRWAGVVCGVSLLLTSAAPGQDDGDKVDLGALTAIKNEAFNHSQVMENLFYISEVYGPRVNNSRNHRAAAEWAMQKMKEWGLQNVHLEKWGPFRRWVADQEVLRRAGDTGLCIADRVSAGMDSGDERAGDGRGGAGAVALAGGLRQVQGKVEGKDRADLRAARAGDAYGGGGTQADRRRGGGADED